MKQFRKYLFLFLAAFVLSEVGVRMVGLGDFPIYETDPLIGYIPRPNQSGKFIHRNEWYFNDKSMGVPENFKTDERKDILLIGDSIVLGGNPYRHSEKLGQQLQKNLGPSWHIWPVGAPSWGFLNEKEYLDRNPEVSLGVEGIVWVINSGDFQERSQWWTDSTHPRVKPLLIAPYFLNKYLIEGHLSLRFPSFFFWVKPSAPDSRKAIDLELGHFINEINRLQKNSWQYKVIVFYPNRDETENVTLNFYDSFSTRLGDAAEKAGWKFLAIREKTNWESTLYRDEIHLTAGGYEVLAKEVAEIVRK